MELHSQGRVVIKQGEIWWANLPEPEGSMPGYRRPVAVVQSDEFNRSRIKTVIVAAITSNVALSTAPGNVFLPKRSAGLPRESVVNVSQVLTLDKSFLTKKVGRLPKPKQRDVEEGLRLVFAL